MDGEGRTADHSCQQAHQGCQKGELIPLVFYTELALQVEGETMKELVEVIAKNLVEHPDEVVVTESKDGRVTKVNLQVAASDMGKVIGRQGRIAKAIRAVVKAAASRDDEIVDVNIESRDSAAPAGGQ